MSFYQAREFILAHKPKLLAVDGNLSPDTLKVVVSECLRNGVDGKLLPRYKLREVVKICVF
jgi:pseudouridine-5'-phosphate glycosidase/pseudouridine kinase